jgi:hypothetical protein
MVSTYIFIGEALTVISDRVRADSLTLRFPFKIFEIRVNIRIQYFSRCYDNLGIDSFLNFLHTWKCDIGLV